MIICRNYPSQAPGKTWFYQLNVFYYNFKPIHDICWSLFPYTLSYLPSTPMSVPLLLSYKPLSTTSLNQGYLYNYRFVSIRWGLLGSAVATQLKTMVSPHSAAINSHFAAMGAHFRIPTIPMIECLQGQSWGLSADNCNCWASMNALVVWSPCEGIF